MSKQTQKDNRERELHCVDSTPTAIARTIEKDPAEAMAAPGIDPRIIYASRKTGLLVTEENLDKLPQEALEE